ncbi:MAG: ABC transporter permease [Methanobacteriota archaeon]|nr:MAG: ABC transporter permease [Euryarchaeota archaeon]
MDSNWTEPWLFMVYSVIKPIAGAFILVLMYTVFALIGRFTDPDLFSYIYVGNAFFIFVGNTLFGTFQVIQSDREWYQTLRYTYISPISYYTYIVGRAASKVAVAALAVVITLAFGALALGVRFEVSLAQIPLFLAALVLGLFCLISIGICLAGISFMTAKHTHGLAEGIPGIFYVFCGVLFPLSALPGWAQSFGRGIPLTYWFDLTRRLLLPPTSISTGLASCTGGVCRAFTDGEILALLLASSLIFFLMSLGIFKLGEYLARRAGKIDMTTSY